MCQQMLLQPILGAKPAQTNITADGFDGQLAGSAALVEHEADDAREVCVAAGAVASLGGDRYPPTFAAIQRNVLSQVTMVGEGIVTSHAHNALLLGWVWELHRVGQLQRRLGRVG